MRQVAYLSDLIFRGHGLDAISHQETSQRQIPSPRLYMRHIKFRNLILVHEPLELPMHHTCKVPLGIFYIFHKHIVIIVCPDSRQIPQVMTQLTSGMRSGEIAEVRGQSNVMFWVENV